MCFGWPDRVRSTGRVAQRQEAAPCRFKWYRPCRITNLRACYVRRENYNDCLRWSLLSLRDPAALTGRPGHPFEFSIFNDFASLAT